MTNIINLTPHEIVMVGNNNEIIVRYPSQGIARAVAMAKPVGEVNGIPLVEMSYGRPEGLPEPVEGTCYLVSMITAAAAAEYSRSVDDLLITADLVRDDHGNVVGCRKFARYHK